MPQRLALILLLVSSAAFAAKRDAAEEAYQSARKAYYSLKGDAARRKLRHHWLNVVGRFESVATDYPKSERAPDALFTAGELMTELSRISFLPEDLQAAVTDYSKVVEGHPRHKLADDAALSLARIHLERLEQPEAARRIINDALAANSKGDRARELKELLASLPAAKPSAPALVEAISKVATPEAPAPKASEPPHVVVITPLKSENPPAPAAKPVSEPIAKVEAPAAKVEAPVVAASAPAPSPAVDMHAAEARFKAAAKLSRHSELTLVEQLGLKVRRVIIDPGHGGHDTGAIGKEGTREKDITLAISQKLAAQLKERGLEVILTRDEDRYIRLEDRAQFANEARGDLFISVHCNSAASAKLHGVETYTLNISSDRYSIRLAARENASTEKGISDLQFILADLATKANTGESTRLASQVQKSLIGQLSHDYSGVKDLGTKEALFYVLLGVKMPAILVETSFLSHSEEEQRLNSEAYQDSVAQSIAQGVEEFLTDRNRLAKVD
jgi:N-acetylmuramoyl-L-alanine amidase